MTNYGPAAVTDRGLTPDEWIECMDDIELLHQVAIAAERAAARWPDLADDLAMFVQWMYLAADRDESGLADVRIPV